MQLVIAAAMAAVSGGAAPAETSTPPATVSVATGPTEVVGFSGPCDDAVVPVDQATAFVLARDGDLSPLEVTIRATGSAAPGEHVAALPDTVAFPTGATEVTVPLEVQATTPAELVELQLEVLPGEGYAPAEPVQATATFATPAAGPSECGFRIAGGPQLTRSVELGRTPEPIVVEELVVPADFFPIEDPAAYTVRVVDGALPAGLALEPDGRFTGSAQSVETREATIEACRTGPPGTCASADAVLTVTQVADRPEDVGTSTGRTGAAGSATGPADELPATGAGLASLAVAGALLTATGGGMLRRSRRPAAGPQLRS